MASLGVLQIVAGIIVAHDDILLISIAIRHKHRRQPRAVGDQSCGDVLCADRVGLEVISHGGLGTGALRLSLSQHGQSIQDSRKIRPDVHSDTKKHGNCEKDEAIQEQKPGREPRRAEQSDKDPGNARIKYGRRGGRGIDHYIRKSKLTACRAQAQGGRRMGVVGYFPEGWTRDSLLGKGRGGAMALLAGRRGLSI